MASEGGLSLTLAEIAARLGGDVLGDGQTRVSRVATLASAGAGDIAFLANPKYRSQLQTTQASAVILAPATAGDFAGARIVTANPYACYARVVALLNPSQPGVVGVHPSAAIASPLPADGAVGAHVSIGRDVTVQAGSSGTKTLGYTPTSGSGSFTGNVTLNDSAPEMRLGKNPAKLPKADAAAPRLIVDVPARTGVMEKTVQ